MSYDKSKKGDRFRPRDSSILDYYFKGKEEYLLNMSGDPELDKLLDKISDMVKEEGKNVTTSQLRNIYGKIKPIKELNELKMMRPQLAYISAREKSKAGRFQWKVEQFIGFIDELIQKTNKETLTGFKDFMEAIVAYHKFHHPKNG